MTKNRRPVRFTGQHFTMDAALIADTIKTAKLSKSDTVLDIGAGKGFLTSQTALQCKILLAIENDASLLRILRKKFADHAQVKIIDSDFRDFKIPDKDFKVVSNIPFNLTSCVLKTLMFDGIPYFMGGAIIMQLEPARKLFSEKVYNPYIIFYRTFFEFELVYEISPKCFLPPPKVKPVLVRIERKRKNATLDWEQKNKYLLFVRRFLAKPDLPVNTALKKVFRKSQVREICSKYGIDPLHPVSFLSADQWKACFLEMLDRVPEKHHPNGDFHHVGHRPQNSMNQ